MASTRSEERFLPLRTTFTVAPSVSSCTSSTVSSVVHTNIDTKGLLHDSTISRLIDAVSLDEEDTCGSISALISQFNVTADQKDLTLSHNCTFSPHSANHQTTSALKSPFKTTSTPNNSQQHRPNHLSYPTFSPPCNISTPLHQKNLSSPETADLEEVYTILDEEVLLPVSAYNLNNKQASQVKGDSIGNSTIHNSSPTKASQYFEKGPSWVDTHNNWGKCIEETEESVYEEVFDPPEEDLSKSKPPPVENCYCFPYTTTQNGFTEVEINVDEDPLDRIMVTPKYGRGTTSPTKRHAIYQNNDSPSNYFDSLKTASYSELKQTVIHKSHLSSSQCSSPVNKPLYRKPDHYYNQNQSSYRPYASSPLLQNNYSVHQSNSEGFNVDSNRNYTQNREINYNTNQIQHMTNHDLETNSFQYKMNSSEFLTRQSSNIDRDMVSSPSVESPQNHLRYNCLSPTPESSSVHNPYLQSYTRSNQDSLSANRQCSGPRFSLQTSFELSMSPSNNSKLSTTPSQGKSKSLGDLTSEDISCNFQGKYQIISRSFISSKQSRMGATGLAHLQTQSCDPLTEQLRKLVTLEADDHNRKRSESPQQQTQSPLSHREISIPFSPTPRNVDDSPPLLTRRLSSRSQSRVRNINNRARERQQEALRPRAGELLNNPSGIGGVVLRNKASMLNPPASRPHSTGSYIAGYLSQMEDRGLPEGACTSLRYGHDRYHTDDSLVPQNSSSQSLSEPEVYFLLRL